MSNKSGISWTDTTWSPVTGCDPISAGCKNCYAKREVEQRWSKNPKSVFFGRDFNDVQCHESALTKPLHWKKGQSIFVGPRSDLFHDDVPFEFIDNVFAVMALAKQHVFQVLTKRPERMREYLADLHPGSKRVLSIRQSMAPFMALVGNPTWPIRFPLPNVWLGVSAENQEAYDERVAFLRQTPAAVRWVSAEPLLSQIEADLSGIDWVVVGGESGQKARPMHPDWVRSLRDQCDEACVPYLFKQWGEWTEEDPGETAHKDCAGVLPSGGALLCSEGYRPPFDTMERLNESGGVRLDGRTLMFNVGKKRANRMLDGVLHDAYPKVMA